MRIFFFNSFLIVFTLTSFSLGAQNEEIDLIRVEFWNPIEGIENWVRMGAAPI